MLYDKRREAVSVRALAKALGRDYRIVHAGVRALAGAGVIDATSDYPRADYDVIETRIAI